MTLPDNVTKTLPVGFAALIELQMHPDVLEWDIMFRREGADFILRAERLGKSNGVTVRVVTDLWRAPCVLDTTDLCNAANATLKNIQQANIDHFGARPPLPPSQGG
jgi:hypothetical protein